MIFKRLVALAFVSNMYTCTVQAENFSVTVKAEQWDMPRHGEILIKQSSLRDMVNRWRLAPASKIEIRYPGGEEGELWVRELMDWLIALGVPSSAMTGTPGSGAEDVINLVLVPPR
ncbi:MAG: hypothetical protein OQL06_06100 [Gammaproteobacteria bacterium]|nr:hypothetical protein [Gammaproteobacteria bacterium]